MGCRAPPAVFGWCEPGPPRSPQRKAVATSAKAFDEANLRWSSRDCAKDTKRDPNKLPLMIIDDGY